MRSGVGPTRPLVPSAVIGVLIFIGAATMFFAGLMSAFMILKAGAIAWPPPNQPRLPGPVTAANTALLLFSGFTVARASGALRRSNIRTAAQWLAITAALGTIFLVVQGSEWIRLVNHGLGASGGNYAGVFYTLVGAHAIHLLGGLLFLAIVAYDTRRGRYSATHFGGVSAAQIYWFFIIFVWLVLYVVVYQ